MEGNSILLVLILLEPNLVLRSLLHSGHAYKREARIIQKNNQRNNQRKPIWVHRGVVEALSLWKEDKPCFSKYSKISLFFSLEFMQLVACTSAVRERQGKKQTGGRAGAAVAILHVPQRHREMEGRLVCAQMG